MLGGCVPLCLLGADVRFVISIFVVVYTHCLLPVSLYTLHLLKARKLASDWCPPPTKSPDRRSQAEVREPRETSSGLSEEPSLCRPGRCGVLRWPVHGAGLWSQGDTGL